LDEIFTPETSDEEGERAPPDPAVVEKKEKNLTPQEMIWEKLEREANKPGAVILPTLGEEKSVAEKPCAVQVDLPFPLLPTMWMPPGLPAVKRPPLLRVQFKRVGISERRRLKYEKRIKDVRRRKAYLALQERSHREEEERQEARAKLRHRLANRKRRLAAAIRKNTAKLRAMRDRDLTKKKQTSRLRITSQLSLRREEERRRAERLKRRLYMANRRMRLEIADNRDVSELEALRSQDRRRERLRRHQGWTHHLKYAQTMRARILRLKDEVIEAAGPMLGPSAVAESSIPDDLAKEGKAIFALQLDLRHVAHLERREKRQQQAAEIRGKIRELAQKDDHQGNWKKEKESCEAQLRQVYRDLKMDQEQERRSITKLNYGYLKLRKEELIRQGNEEDSAIVQRVEVELDRREKRYNRDQTQENTEDAEDASKVRLGLLGPGEVPRKRRLMEIGSGNPPELDEEGWYDQLSRPLRFGSTIPSGEERTTWTDTDSEPDEDKRNKPVAVVYGEPDENADQSDTGEDDEDRPDQIYDFPEESLTYMIPINEDGEDGMPSKRYMGQTVDGMSFKIDINRKEGYVKFTTASPRILDHGIADTEDLPRVSGNPQIRFRHHLEKTLSANKAEAWPKIWLNTLKKLEEEVLPYNTSMGKIVLVHLEKLRAMEARSEEARDRARAEAQTAGLDAMCLIGEGYSLDPEIWTRIARASHTCKELVEGTVQVPDAEAVARGPPSKDRRRYLKGHGYLPLQRLETHRKDPKPEYSVITPEDEDRPIRDFVSNRYMNTVYNTSERALVSDILRLRKVQEEYEKKKAEALLPAEEKKKAKALLPEEDPDEGLDENPEED
jgi:hypothetical protein